MRSKLAEQCREEMVEICRRMTPAERLEAFVNHSKALTELYRAGEAYRRERRAMLQQSTSADNS